MSLLWNLNPEWGRAFADMLVFDAIVCNDDRRQGNVAPLRGPCDAEVLLVREVQDANRSNRARTLVDGWVRRAVPGVVVRLLLT